MKKKIFYLFFILFLLYNYIHTSSKANEIKIIAKIGNNIITNIDITDEKKYLKALNKNLQNIDNETLTKIAKESLIRENIKKVELLKYYNLGEKNQFFDNAIVQIYNNLGFESLEKFQNYLNDERLTYQNVYMKIEIESLWNQLIYARYNERLIINKKDLETEILKNKKKQKFIKFTEILFSFDKKEEINSKYDQIINDLKFNSFSEIVAKYSISDSAKNLGSLDWVNENILSERIKVKIKNLKIDEISQPIIIPSGALILKVDDIKFVNAEIDLEKELEKSIQYEINNQLNNYSVIHYNKIKNKQIINEY